MAAHAEHRPCPAMSVASSEASALSIPSTPVRQFPPAPMLVLQLKYEPPRVPAAGGPPAGGLPVPPEPYRDYYHYTPRTTKFIYESFQTTVQRTLRDLPAFLMFMWDLHIANTLDDMRRALHLPPHTRMRLFVNTEIIPQTWLDHMREITPQKLFNETERIIMCNDEDGLFGNGMVVVVRVDGPL
ncbi:hypothetical protein DFH27DRAFT_573334 [Peziza echinospora]|nr:hypothetical protein DFH27DRAFT_573334 [Peziza echinospora]